MKIIETPIEELRHYLEQISILLVTATDIETNEVINNLFPFPNAIGVIQISSGNQTYYIGVFGIYGVAVVQSGMGAVGSNASLITTLRAIDLFKPKAVIMIGIAFGIDSEKQHIGDVIVSSHIIPYENARIGKERVFRSELPPASSLLLNRVKQIRDWNFPVSRDRYAKLYVGPILSGEKLLDNITFRNDLANAFPNAIGGEMESAGVYAASNEKKIDWLIIKGICDFADGEKTKNKKEYQAIAIKSVVSFTERVLNIRYGFIELGFIPLRNSQREEPKTTGTSLLTDLIALFDAIEKQDIEKAQNTFNVVARQVVQTDVENKYNKEVSTLQMLVPKHVLHSFERRIDTCWTMYNQVLATDDEYLPTDSDNASIALQKCICRELNRLLIVNGEIPNGFMLDYWGKYKCRPKS